MDDKGLSLKDSVWSQLDRKAGAIIELTIRQLRHSWHVEDISFASRQRSHCLLYTSPSPRDRG